MDIKEHKMDLNVLEFVIDKDHDHLIEAVADSSSTLDAAIGVAKFLIANKGDLSLLKGKQNYVYETCLKPVFRVPCEGLIGDVEDGDSCSGDGFVDEDLLMQCYQDDDFRCQLCRYDSD
jgi:hypothetical protein